MERLPGLLRFSVCHVQGEINDVGRTKPMSSVLAVLALELCFHCMNITNCSTLLVFQEEECQGLFYSLIAFFSLER